MPNGDFKEYLDSVFEGEEQNNLTDGDYAFYETLTTDAPRNICAVYVDSIEGISVSCDELDTDGIVGNYGMDGLNNYQYRLLLKHSKPF